MSLQTPPADPDYQDLTGFQRDVVRILARKGETYGLAIKRALEDLYGEEVNHSRLYPNLDNLVEAGVLDKSEIDKRTNGYRLSEAGERLARRSAQRWVTATDALDGEDVDRGEGIRADGGVIEYECPDCGPVNGCDVENGQRRCRDCGSAVSAVVTDGGETVETTTEEIVVHEEQVIYDAAEAAEIEPTGAELAEAEIDSDGNLKLEVRGRPA